MLQKQIEAAQAQDKADEAARVAKAKEAVESEARWKLLRLSEWQEVQWHDTKAKALQHEQHKRALFEARQRSEDVHEEESPQQSTVPTVIPSAKPKPKAKRQPKRMPQPKAKPMPQAKADDQDKEETQAKKDTKAKADEQDKEEKEHKQDKNDKRRRTTKANLMCMNDIYKIRRPRIRASHVM